MCTLTAKRKKITYKSQSQEIKINKYERLSNNALGINASDNLIRKSHLNVIQHHQTGNYPPSILFQTGLSNIANHQAQYGMFHEQDLNQLIHQQKVLKNKLCLLRQDLGSRIEQQREPLNSLSPWDHVLNEVVHIAKRTYISTLMYGYTHI